MKIAFIMHVKAGSCIYGVFALPHFFLLGWAQCKAWFILTKEHILCYLTNLFTHPEFKVRPPSHLSILYSIMRHIGLIICCYKAAQNPNCQIWGICTVVCCRQNLWSDLVQAFPKFLKIMSLRDWSCGR